MGCIMSNELRFNINCDERPEWFDSDDKQLIGDVDMTINYGEPFIPINPDKKEPYLKAFFADKSIKELEAMFRQEPNIEAPSNSKK